MPKPVDLEIGTAASAQAAGVVSGEEPGTSPGDPEADQTEQVLEPEQLGQFAHQAVNDAIKFYTANVAPNTLAPKYGMGEPLPYDTWIKAVAANLVRGYYLELQNVKITVSNFQAIVEAVRTAFEEIQSGNEMEASILTTQIIIPLSPGTFTVKYSGSRYGKFQDAVDRVIEIYRRNPQVSITALQEFAYTVFFSTIPQEDVDLVVAQIVAKLNQQNGRQPSQAD